MVAASAAAALLHTNAYEQCTDLDGTVYCANAFYELSPGSFSQKGSCIMGVYSREWPLPETGAPK